LRLRLLAKKVVRKPAVAADDRLRRAELLGPSEIRHGRLGIAVCDLHRAHSGLRQRATRVDVVGPGEEAGSRLAVAKLKGRSAGADQRVEILGIVGKRPNVTR